MSVTGLVSGCGTAHKSLLLLSRIKKFDFCTDNRDSALKVVFTDEVQMFSCSHMSQLWSHWKTSSLLMLWDNDSYLSSTFPLRWAQVFSSRFTSCRHVNSSLIRSHVEPIRSISLPQPIRFKQVIRSNEQEERERVYECVVFMYVDLYFNLQKEEIINHEIFYFKLEYVSYVGFYFENSSNFPGVTKIPPVFEGKVFWYFGRVFMAYMCDVTQLLLDGKLFLKQQQLLLKIHTNTHSIPRTLCLSLRVCVCMYVNTVILHINSAWSALEPSMLWENPDILPTMHRCESCFSLEIVKLFT